MFPFPLYHRSGEKKRRMAQRGEKRRREKVKQL